MAGIESEQDQLLYLKQLWRDHGRRLMSVIAGLLLLLLLNQIWQNHQQGQSERASLAYQELLEATLRLQQQSESIDPDSEVVKSVDHLAKQFLVDHKGSSYDDFAQLLLASKAVRLSDWQTAETHLRALLGRNPVKSLALLARYRLAQVLLQQEQYEAAMQLLDVLAEGSFTLLYLELQGDIAYAMGNPDLALNFYQSAVDMINISEQQGRLEDIVRMKLFDLRSR